MQSIGSTTSSLSPAQPAFLEGGASWEKQTRSTSINWYLGHLLAPHLLQRCLLWTLDLAQIGRQFPEGKKGAKGLTSNALALSIHGPIERRHCLSLMSQSDGVRLHSLILTPEIHFWRQGGRRRCEPEAQGMFGRWSLALPKPPVWSERVWGLRFGMRDLKSEEKKAKQARATLVDGFTSTLKPRSSTLTISFL